MSDMPKEIWARKMPYGDWAVLTDPQAFKDNADISYTRTDTIQAMQDKIDEQQRVVEKQARLLNLAKAQMQTARDMQSASIEKIIDIEVALTQAQKEG